MTKKQKIYRDYLTRPNGVSDKDIADKYKVTRGYVHQVLTEITRGKRQRASLKERINQCLDNKRKECLWECWLKDWFEAMGEMRRTKSHQPLVDDFVKLVQTMKKEGFTKNEIARLTGRNHSTIEHHLKKK